jgi:DNA polymerase-1
MDDKAQDAPKPWTDPGGSPHHGGPATAEDTGSPTAAPVPAVSEPAAVARTDAREGACLPGGTGPTLCLSKTWAERLEAVHAASKPSAVAMPPVILPRAPRHYAGQVTLVRDAAGAQALLDLARQRPLAFVGLDTEFRHDRPGVVLPRNKVAYDPGSVRPLLLSAALAEPGDGGTLALYPFVVDLRVPEAYPALARLFQLPCRFVAHYAHAELLCLRRLGLPEPETFWDTWVCEKALHLGRNHKKYKVPAGADDAEEARVAEEGRQEDEFSYGLVATCQRHGVAYPFAGDKERLQHSFLGHPDGAAFSKEQIDYAAADAVAAAALYLSQVQAAARAGVLRHLELVEMPWVTTNANMAGRGVRLDRDLCRRVESVAHDHAERLRARLAAEHGIANPDSHPQLQDFFHARGLLHLFRRDGRVSFDKQMLEEFQGHHPAIALLRAYRRVSGLMKTRLLGEEFVGADGRVHPNYTQLGTHTGRQTSWGPNILGLGRVFRPLVVPEPGRGLGEADLSQIEVGVAAAVHRDDRLIDMFNTGDVYSAMAQDFFGDRLPEGDRAMPSGLFKKKHKDLRDRMKTCTLGIIYGLTAHGLALRLKTQGSAAAALLGRFMAMFPTLRQALAETPDFGGLRGYVETSTGLRRHRDRPRGALPGWERNWMNNHLVQGSAAVVFKAAGNRLDRLYRRYGAWLLVPLHDAYLFEAPLGVLREVADLTGRVLCEAVQEYFPALRPRAEVNIEYPGCWNKDAHHDSVERWLQDPAYSL